MHSWILTSLWQDEIQMLALMHSTYAYEIARIGLSDLATELYDSEDNVVMT